MIWISRLTLFAYLLGGWLLPAAHFHAHPGSGVHGFGGHGSGSCAAHQHDEADTLAAKPHSHDCCDHRGQGPEPNGTSSDCRTPADDRIGLVAADAVIFCDGLCALCSARTLASTQLNCIPCLSVRLIPQPLGWVASDTVFAGRGGGERFSRGPPAIV